MCFHYAMSQVAKNLENRYNATFKATIDFAPVHHANGFSHPAMPVITSDLPNIIQQFKWGLVPSWIKDEAQAKQTRQLTLNARSETVFEKASFKNAIIKKRCLVPADGFFEWQEVAKIKIPWFIHLKATEIFSFGGIWEEWKNTANDTWFTFSIVTTEANPLMAEIHTTKKRMPLILSRENEKIWLDATLPPNEINGLMKPYSDKDMSAFTIGRLISSKNSNTNIPSVKKPFQYPELNPPRNLFST